MNDPSHQKPATPSNTMDALSRLSELFADRPVGELAIILDRYDNNVKEASWAILNGETAENIAASSGQDTSNDDGGDGSAGGVDNAGAGRNNSLPVVTEHYGSEGTAQAQVEGGGSAKKNADLFPVFPKADGPAAATKSSSRDTIGGAAPAEIQRLYDEGTITKDEYDQMVEADKRAAQIRESRTTPPDVAQHQQTQQTSLVQDRLQFLGAKLQKINLAKLIDQMEQDQEYADHLDFINKEIEEEADRKRMVREAEQQSIEIMKEHLEEFLRRNARATYESWIGELHPDNVVQGKLLEDVGSTEIDHRFYVVDSDHRRIWNQSLSERNDGDRRDYVNARSNADKSERNGQTMRDLLGGSAFAVSSAIDGGANKVTAATAAVGGCSDDIDLLKLDRSIEDAPDESVEGTIEAKAEDIDTKPDPQAVQQDDEKRNEDDNEEEEEM